MMNWFVRSSLRHKMYGVLFHSGPMASLFSLATIALSTSYAAAQATVPVFGQCGGLTYDGPTVCAAGSFCQWDSDFFSQCVPGTAPPPFAGPINFWFPFGDSYTTTDFNTTSVLPNIHNPIGNPPFPGFTGGGGENYVGFDTETYNASVIFTYNYAFGGATINASLVAPFEPGVLSLIDQVNEFLTGGVASQPATTPWTSANALFSVWIGVNDLAGSYFEPGDRGAFADVSLFFAQPKHPLMLIRWTMQTLLDEYFALMQNLYAFPPLPFGISPQFSISALLARATSFSSICKQIAAEGTAAQAQLEAVITDFNTRLASRVSSFEASNSGVTTWLWDSNAVFTTILSDPTAFGFVDAVSFGNTGDFWG
ncbi:CBM1 domain-containing protein [Mycena sanguinolenta]|uniref:CBM1 domain-containing protein n=1 Tax=Mycena sanguinolenta TaxID=230812 RepID=A0A8H6ZFS6_9AGAR|nr:CBM1 domain-containing protein [Mycena sanguinolenta]